MKLAVILILLAAVAIAGLAYIRLAPSDVTRWHVEPGEAPDPGSGGVQVAPGRITSSLAPADLMGELDAAIRQEPRVTLLAGSPASGHATYVARSRIMGFPDYITFRATASGVGSTLSVLSRLRFGGYDFGVNRARIERVLGRVGLSLPD